MNSELNITVRRTAATFWRGQEPKEDIPAINQQLAFERLAEQQLVEEFADSGYDFVRVEFDLNNKHDEILVKVIGAMDDPIDVLDDVVLSVNRVHQHQAVEWRGSDW